MKVSFTEESKTDKCPSCGVKYINHPGLIPTCKKLQEYESILHEIKNALKLPEKFGDRDDRRAICRINELIKNYEKGKK